LGYYIEYEFGLKGKNTSKLGIYAWPEKKHLT
jgi:hypothetical protein